MFDHRGCDGRSCLTGMRFLFGTRLADRTLMFDQRLTGSAQTVFDQDCVCFDPAVPKTGSLDGLGRPWGPSLRAAWPWGVTFALPRGAAAPSIVQCQQAAVTDQKRVCVEWLKHCSR